MSATAMRLKAALSSTAAARSCWRRPTRRGSFIGWSASDPDAVAGARWFLGVPLTIGPRRLSGVAVSERTCLGAQSHLWNAAERCWTPIVKERGWRRLMPPFANAWDVIGTISPALAARYGLPTDIAILAGGHDSSLNHYRYRAAGLKDFSLVSTGTWIARSSGYDAACRTLRATRHDLQQRCAWRASWRGARNGRP